MGVCDLLCGEGKTSEGTEAQCVWWEGWTLERTTSLCRDARVLMISSEVIAIAAGVIMQVKTAHISEVM